MLSIPTLRMTHLLCLFYKFSLTIILVFQRITCDITAKVISMQQKQVAGFYCWFDYHGNFAADPYCQSARTPGNLMNHNQPSLIVVQK